jgi:D-arabinose 1-dehydrogenase-like Zn-dependent alcohol dehydrogenase
MSDLIELVSLVKRNIITSFISNRLSLEEATKALRMLKDGNILSRSVIYP